MNTSGVTAPPTGARARSRALSLRTALILIGVGALAYVAVMGIAIERRVVPAAEEVQRRGRIALSDYEGCTSMAARLDDVMTDLWRLLRLARAGTVAKDNLRTHREEIEGLLATSVSLSPTSRTVAMPQEMRRLLGDADIAATRLSSVMLGAIGALEQGDVPAAERLLQRADSLDTPLNQALSSITTSTLRDVNKAEGDLAASARGLSTMVTVWLIVGVLLLPMLVLFLRRRLYAPLASLERGLTRIERGDLDVVLSVRRDDELGRLESQFNRMTGILRQRREYDAEQALYRTAERTRDIFESALDAVVVFDAQRRIQEWSPQAVPTFGWTRDEALGQSFIDLIIPEAMRDSARESVARLTAPEGVRAEQRRLELPAQRRDGSQFTVEVSIAPLESAGVTEYAAFLRDVTEQKRLSEELRQAQKMEAVGQLAGGVAHDFNNLLTGIIGYADLLQHDAVASDEMREDAASIRATALRGADLARSLLTLARRSPHREEPVDVHAVTREVADLIRRTFDRRIEVRTEFAAHSARVIGDHSLLSNALLNLALNARDAMPDGGTLTISTRTTALDGQFLARHAATGEPGAYLALVVRDTGMGMPPETQARIFEPFFTTKEPGKGTGLGLAMVYGTLKAHGGLIAVESSAGAGTAFSLYLPSRPDSAAETGAAASTFTRGRGRILLVDDEELLRNVATRMLTRLGYEVECADDGQAAVQRLASDTHGVDLVILDGNMPRLSGLEAARVIHARHPALPLVFASGYFDPSITDSPAVYGFREVIVKPYTLDQVSRVVARCLHAAENAGA